MFYNLRFKIIYDMINPINNIPFCANQHIISKYDYNV